MAKGDLVLRERLADDGGGPWRAAALAALPHLLMSTTFFGVSEAFGGRGLPWYPYFLVIVLAVACFFAWRGDWPLWSGSWTGYWLFLALPLATTVGRTNWELSEVLFVLFLAGACLWLAQRRPLHGLLASMPLLVFIPHVWAFEHVAGGNLVWGGLFVLLALTASAMVSLKSVRAGALLAISFEVVTGIAITLGRLYLPWRFEQMGVRQTPAAAELINSFAPITLALVAGTAALLLFGTLRRLYAGDERRNRNVLFGGMLLALRARQTPPPDVLPLAAVLAGGLLLSLGAALALMRATWSDGQRGPRRLLGPLLSALAPLVVLALAAPVAPDGAYSQATQVGILLGYGGVALWLGGALWVIWGVGQAQTQRCKGKTS